MAKILCIDDEADLRGIIIEELNDLGFETIEAENGTAGLEAIIQHKPDLVLCDITMPGVSGYEVLSTLRESHPEMSDMPFLFLTALGGREDIVAGRKLGADDYLSKPIDFDVLEATINSRLGQVTRMGNKKNIEMDEFRNQILGILSHEMRTPLNHILGFSEMISSEAFGPIENKVYVDYANQVATAGKLLLRSIEDALTLADIISGNIVADPESCDLGALLAKCVEDRKPNEMQINLNLPDKPPKVTSDAGLLSQALSALISNAIKFSNDSKPLHVNLEVNAQQEIRISIVDHGIGMSEKQKEKVSKVFCQADEGITRNFDGFGIGLPLVEQICRLLNCRFEISSKVDVGTTATIIFPAQSAKYPI